MNPQAARLGLGWAKSWTDGPILCVIRPEAVRFVAVSERRFVASWDWLEETGTPYRFFLLPLFVANTLASPAAYEITGLHVRVNRTLVVLTVRDRHGEYVLQWHWQPASFDAPPFFDQMVQPPREAREESYIAIADAVHLAIANLGRLEAMEAVKPEELAIVVDFAPGRVMIDGQPITVGSGQRFFFDPRLIIRGMEVVRGRHIGFSLAATAIPGQAVLYMASQRDRWRIQCALLSILPDEQTRIISQRVRPLPKTDRLVIRTRGAGSGS